MNDLENELAWRGARIAALEAELQALKAREPAAWANWKVGTKSYVPYRTKEDAERCVRRSEIAATQNGPYEVVPLYAAPQENKSHD